MSGPEPFALILPHAARRSVGAQLGYAFTEPHRTCMCRSRIRSRNGEIVVA